MKPLLFPVVLALASTLGSCNSNPVHDGEVAALGPEAPGVPVGQYHRAGQPCGVCHGGQGPAKTVFTVAGTVFSGPYSGTVNNTVGVNGAILTFVDDNGAMNFASTNCVGNFWFSAPGQPTLGMLTWNPEFPLRVEVGLAGGSNVPMLSHVGREASCATCHQDPPGVETVGHVYYNTPAQPNNPNCPVSPVARQVGP